MRLPRLRDIRSRREFRSARYLLRYLLFFMRSNVQQDITATIWGSNYHLRANKSTLGIDGYLYIFREDWEPEVRDALLKYFKDGWLFIDVGANSGYWSKFIAERFSQSRIIAFEPFKRTFESLNANLAKYANRAQLCNSAVSDAEQIASLVCSSDPGGNHLGSSQKGATEEVKVVTLDKEAERIEWMKGCAAHCLIKIDVEGYELHVLKGASNFIRTSRPIIVLEIIPEYLARAHSTADEMFSLIEDLQYNVFSLSGSAHLRKIESELDFLPGEANYIAMHKDENYR